MCVCVFFREAVKEFVKTQEAREVDMLGVNQPRKLPITNNRQQTPVFRNQSIFVLNESQVSRALQK